MNLPPFPFSVISPIRSIPHRKPQSSMFPTLATSLSFLFVCLLFPSPTASQTPWDYPVDFRSSTVWPSETCVQSCLTGDQCTPCGGYSLSTWVGCTTNSCFCNRYDVAYYYLVSCISANCCPTCVSTNPYQLIYGYCQSTAEKVNGGGAAVTTTFTAPPSVTPTEKPVSNPCTLRSHPVT